MSEDGKLKARLLADARAHLTIHGPKNWDLVRAKYPDVNERRFFRWIKELREGVATRGPLEEMERDGEKAGVGKAAHAEAIAEGADRARMAAIKNIPAAPSPEYMARAGIRAEEQINFLAAITRLFKDGEMLRAYSVIEDSNAPGGERLKNPMVFATSIEKRLRVLDTSVRIMQEVWDLQYMQRFFDEIVEIIVEEIGPAHPEIQTRILARLKDLNDRRGMTQYAGMG